MKQKNNILILILTVILGTNATLFSCMSHSSRLKEKDYQLEIRDLQRVNKLYTEREEIMLESADRIIEENATLRGIVSSKEKKAFELRKIKRTIINTTKALPDTPRFQSARNLTRQDVNNISSYILDYSYKYDVPVALSVALIRHESAFVPDAVSHAGAIGLAQVMPMTAEHVNNSLKIKGLDLYNPKHNVQVGLFYMSEMLHSFRHEQSYMTKAINAYNAGPRNIRAGFMPAETRGHQERIMEYYKEFLLSDIE